MTPSECVAVLVVIVRRPDGLWFRSFLDAIGMYLAVDAMPYLTIVIDAHAAAVLFPASLRCREMWKQSRTWQVLKDDGRMVERTDTKRNDIHTCLNACYRAPSLNT